MAKIITKSPSLGENPQLGLDRANINDEGDVQLMREKTRQSEPSDSGFSEGDDESPTHLSKRERFSIKAKKILHISEEPRSEDAQPGPVLADAPDTKSDARLITEPPSIKSHTAKDFLHHPLETVTSKGSAQGGKQVAANIVAKEISHGKEVELVKAHDDVVEAKTETERLLAIKEVEKLAVERQDMFVRWTMDRHVMKVRKLPEHTVPKRGKKDFETLQPDGKKKMNWEGYADHLAKYYAQEYAPQYIGYTSDPPPNPDKNIVMPCVERLLVASVPIQELIMVTRKIYRWEDPYTTLAYLFGYLTLWVSNMILPGMIMGILYLIIHRRYRGPSIEDLRKDIIRTELVQETALSISEFIEKKGDTQWQDELIETLGPWLLIQLADVSNLMETLRNFYEWRVPHRTAWTLSYLALALPIIIFMPTEILVRATTLSMGLVFFALFPISSRLPEYRLLASPVKWLFWNIPTHAEWSIKALQVEGASRKHGRVDSGAKATLSHAQIEHGGPDPMGFRGQPTTKDGQPISPSSKYISKDAVHGTYHGLLDSRSGKVVVSGNGLRFLAAIGHKELWKCKFADIVRLEKVNRVVEKNLPGAKNLVNATGEDLMVVVEQLQGVRTEVLIKNLEMRDQLFSQVVGFADITWQVVW